MRLAKTGGSVEVVAAPLCEVTSDCAERDKWIPLFVAIAASL